MKLLKTIQSICPGQSPREMKNNIPWWQQSIILIAILSILLSRAGMVDFLYGDDTVFYKDALTHPFASIVKPHAGYSQILCRALASLCLFLPDACVVPAFVFVPILTTVVVAAVIMNLSWIDATQRRVLALGTVLLPHASEVYIYLCNANWTASLLPCLLLFQPNLGSIRTGRSSFTIFTMLILGLSSMYVAILSPLYGVRFLRMKRKSSGEAWLLVSIVLVSAVQMLIVISNGFVMSATNDADPAFAPVFSPLVTMINAIFILPFASYVTSVGLLHEALHDIRILIPTALLILVAYIAIGYLWFKADGKHKTCSLIFWGLGYYLLVTAAVRTINALQLYLPMRSCDRYFFLPYFFFTMALLETLVIKRGAVARRVASFFVLTVLVAFYVFEWHITRAPDGARMIWHQQLEKLRTTGTWDFNPKNGLCNSTGIFERPPPVQQ